MRGGGAVDPQAEFLGLFLKNHEDLRAFIGSMIRDRHACDDLLQDVALVLWQKFGEYDRQRSFGAWARGVTAKRILQSFDKARKIPLPFSPEAVEALVEAYDATDTQASALNEALEFCLKTLPEKSRRLITLRYEQAMKLGEIADVLDSSLDAVHKALSRIRIALRRCVEQRLAAG